MVNLLHRKNAVLVQHIQKSRVRATAYQSFNALVAPTLRVEGLEQRADYLGYHEDHCHDCSDLAGR